MTLKNRTVRIFALLGIAAILFLGVLVGMTGAAHGATGSKAPSVVAYHDIAGDRVAFRFRNGRVAAYGPCASEDSVGCWWNASESGNGVGHSFVAVQRHGGYCIAYLAPKYAATHNYCGA